MKSQEKEDGKYKGVFVPIVHEESEQSHIHFEDGQTDEERDKMAYIPLVSIQSGDPPEPEKKENEGDEEAEGGPNQLTPQKMRIFTIFIMTFIVICMTGSTAFHIWNYGGDHTQVKQLKNILKRVTHPSPYDYNMFYEYINSLPFVRDYEEPLPKEDFSSNLPYHKIPSILECDSTPINMRFDCAIDNVDISSESCQERGCCWKELAPHEIPSRPSLRHSELYSPKEQRNFSSKLNVPFCFYPKNYTLYSFVNVQQRSNGVKGILKQHFRSGLPNDVRVLNVEINFETCSTLRIKINDFNNERWETPMPPDNRETTGCSGDMLYNVHLFANEGTLIVRRGTNASGAPVFDMRNAAPLIFSDQFLQFSTLLPSPYVYGLGQHLDGLLLDTYWHRRVLWNADQFPGPRKNLYGSHPFFMSLEPSGDANGLLLLNSNAMDVKLQPAPAATFRTTGGILDVYLFMGPSPDDVIMQMTDRIGRPFLPPYWSLGYHQCRFGYKTLTETKKVWQRTRDAGIPFDVQWNDIDYMHNQNDFTYDKEAFEGLPHFIDELHEAGMHYVIITDPGISGGEEPGSYPPFDVGIEDDVFVKNSTGDLFVGKVWNPKSTVFPDFTKPSTILYWAKMIRGFHEQLPFDGLWIDMNEPSNFWSGQKDGCPNDSVYEHPPYLPPVAGGKLYSNTLCMTAIHFLSSHYNVHNLYGITEMMMTYSAMRMTKGLDNPFIISRSTFLGSGVFGGHWTGDVQANWFNLWKSIGDILTMNIHGIPMVGADICGFNGNTTAALCNRWMQLGAFYPFARNHNSDDTIDQDPVAMGDLVVRSSRKALQQRYMMLPYLYTLFFQAHIDGTPVAKPLFFNYPLDSETYTIDTQFMWGSALMIVPVLEENATSVMAYIPEGRWYDWYTGMAVSQEGGEFLRLEAPLDTIPLLVAGGHIIPCQFPGNTTTESRKNSFFMLIALCKKGEAEGTMYWSEHNNTASYGRAEYTSWSFKVASKKLLIEVSSLAKPSHRLFLGDIKILGIQSKVFNVSINGGDVPFVFNASIQTLEIQHLYLNLIDRWEIEW